MDKNLCKFRLASSASPSVPLLRQPLPYIERLIMLQILDLTWHAEDALLQGLARCLPMLECLGCARSPRLTDKGIESLAADGSGARAALREVDLTFCGGTTYGVTIGLRHALPGLRLIRRQPAWLQGRFLTPFGGPGQKVETHTYYADGSFDFSRSRQSRGYIRWLRESEPDGFLYDSMQYCNFDGVRSWPPWGRFLYRPGVATRAVKHDPSCVTHRDPESTATSSLAGATMQPVLVAQSLVGMRAPTLWPDVPDAQVPLSGTLLLRADGTCLPSDAQLDEASQDGAVAMISRMEVQPLETPMPPDSLVAEIEAFEQERAAFEAEICNTYHEGSAMLATLEEQLHRTLGGS